MFLDISVPYVLPVFVKTKSVVASAKSRINESGLKKLEKEIRSDGKGIRTIQYPVKLR